MSTPSTGTINDSDPHGFDSDVVRTHGETIVTVLWRYKWLTGMLLPIGLATGYWINQQKPQTYRATGNLLLKSDIPLTLDSNTGVMRGGIPNGKLMQSLITSDLIAGRVRLNDRHRSEAELQGLSDEDFVALVRKGIRYQAVTDQKHSRDRIVASINYDGLNPVVCVAAVEAVSEAIREHFREEREQRVNEFEELIGSAQDKLFPQQTELETEYKRFRNSAPLEWGPDGNVVNPHRQNQLRLTAFRDQLEQSRHSLDCELRFAESMSDRHENPKLVAAIIGELSDVFEDTKLVFDTPVQENQAEKRPNSQDDLQMKRIEAKKRLIPLEIEREQLQIAFGWSHPSVMALSKKIASSQRMLAALDQQAAKRRIELQKEFATRPDQESEQKTYASHAKQAVKAYICGLRERLNVTEEDIASLDVKISAEKLAADELKMYEETDRSFRRRIESVQGMLIQLEQQLAELELVDTEGGITVNALRDTVNAFSTGPDLKKDLAVFGLLGFGLSGLLAFCLEASANTFRSAEAIQRELKTPVLTHIPVERGRSNKRSRKRQPSLANLDPMLVAAHRPYSPAAEAVRGIRTAILLERSQKGTQVIQVTSPLPGDGKSTLAANLGCSLAQSGKRTLLIDLDLRSPRLSLRFNLNTKQGLANVLNGEQDAQDVIHQTEIANLSVLPCGPLPSNPAEALTLPQMDEVFQWARKHYDFIIVDTSPLLMVSDPTIVTSYVDAALLVMRIRRRCKPNAKEAMGMLHWSGARVMGVVVNKLNTANGLANYRCSASGSYQSIGYGYGDKYRRRYQREVNAKDTYVVQVSGTQARVDTIASQVDHAPSDPKSGKSHHKEAHMAASASEAAFRNQGLS